MDRREAISESELDVSFSPRIMLTASAFRYIFKYIVIGDSKCLLWPRVGLFSCFPLSPFFFFFRLSLALRFV